MKGFTQTVAATLAVLIFTLLTFGYNEGVYSMTDLDIRLDGEISNSTWINKDCRFTGTVNNTIYGPDNFSVEDDIAREFLYGGFSARFSVVSAIVLTIGAFVLAITTPIDGLDFKMGAEYKTSSVWHEGITRITFFSGVFFRLLIVGAGLSMVLCTFCSLIALAQQGYVPSAGFDFGVTPVDGIKFDPRALPPACENFLDNVVDRSDSLKASVFFSLVSVVAIGFQAYAIRYDKKASSENDGYGPLSQILGSERPLSQIPASSGG